VGESYSARGFIFQQDGATCHNGKTLIKWFRENTLGVLKLPGNSLDVSPMENLSGILKHEIHSEVITTKSELIKLLFVEKDNQI